MQQPTDRPIGVTLIAILLALNGIVVLISAFGFFGLPPQRAVGMIIQVVFGLVMLYLAYGVWTLQAWAWLATMIIEGINALFALLALIVAPGAIAIWVSLILAIVIIVILLQPSVRDAFSQQRAGL